MFDSSTFNQVRSLMEEVKNENKIVARRAACRKLSSTLSNAKVRSRLTSESASIAYSKASQDGGGGTRHDPKQALRQLYRSAVKVSISISTKIIQSKSKSTNEDVIFPFKIFQAIDADSELALTEMKKDDQKRCYIDEPFTFEGFDRYRGTNSTMTYLNMKEILLLKQYCTECLNNETIRAVAEVDLMKFLSKLCSRPDYVCHFHSFVEIDEIMSEIQQRMLNNASAKPKKTPGRFERSSSKGGDCILATDAAKAFYGLIHHLTVTLGVQMCLFVEPCIKLVLEWIDSCCDEDGRLEYSNHASLILPHAYGVAIDLMATYPEQCIAIFQTDNHGRNLWRFTKRFWSMSHSYIQNRDVLVDFFSAYIYVCEIAGNLQGLFPGDMGNVGSASIDSKMLAFLLDSLLSEKSIESFVGKSRNDKNNESLTLRKRKRNSHGGTITFTTLPKRDRRYLELCARVLRIAQRQFLVNEESSLSEDLTTAIVIEHEEANNSIGSETSRRHDGLSSRSGRIPPEKIVSSPWVKFVGRHTIFSNSNSSVSGVTNKSNVKSEFKVKSEFDVPNVESKPKKQNEAMSKKFEFPELLVVPYLQLVATCAEVFPRGECWTSTNRWYRSSFNPLDSDEMDHSESCTYCNTCHPQDIAYVINNISDMLCCFGGASGDTTVQKWSLACLLKLSESSTIACRYWKDDLDALNIVGLAWQKVWTNLFRTDLRYASHTAEALPASLGEMILSLLTEIVRSCLTDPTLFHSYSTEKGQKSSIQAQNVKSFLRSNQEQVWGLPVFKSSQLNISAPFELITALDHIVGIVEGDTDVIDSREFSPLMTEKSNSDASDGTKRRHRLACYCLCFIRNAVQFELDCFRQIIPFVSSCIGSLVGTTSILPLTTYSLQASRIFRLSEDDIELHCQSNELIEESGCALWEDSIFPFSYQYKAENNSFFWRRGKGRDVRLCPAWSSEDRLWYKCKMRIMSKSRCDFVAPSTTNSIINLCTLSIEELGLNKNNQSAESDANASNEMPRLSCHTSVMKFILELGLCVEEDYDHLNIIEYLLHPIFNIVVSTLKISSTSETSDFPFVVTDVLGILKYIKQCHVHERLSSELPRLLPYKAVNQLYRECAMFINSHVLSRSSSSSLSTNTGKKSQASDNSDDDESDHSTVPSQGLSQFDSDDESGSSIDFDDDNAFDSKRRSKGRSKRKKRRKTMSRKRQKHTSSSSPQDEEKINNGKKTIDAKSAWLCSNVMVEIEPTLDIFQRVADAMVWPCDEDCTIEWEGVVFDPHEPHDSLLGLAMLLRQNGEEKDDFVAQNSRDSISFISLCCDIIEKGRDEAGTSSPFHMFGFHFCELLVKTYHGLGSDECKDILFVLHPQADTQKQKSTAKTSLKTRPNLRYAQIRAGTNCFLTGNNMFHDEFDTTFARDFIIPSLVDKSASVRKAAIIAVGAALKLFPSQELIVHETVERLPPIYSAKDVSPDDATYKEWSLSKIDSSSSNEKAKMERDFWFNSKLALEHDTLACFGVIAGHTTDEKLRSDTITNILRLSCLRKDLQPFCFCAMETTSMIRSFDYLEDMFNVEIERFVQIWVRLGHNFESMPLYLLCSGFHRSLLRLGGCWNIFPRPIYQVELGENEEGPNDYLDDKLQYESKFDFIEHNAALLIPIIMVCYEDNSGGKQKQKENNTGKKQLCARVLDYLHEISAVFTDDDTDDLSVFLKRYLHDIYAYILPLIQCKDSLSARQCGSSIVGFLSDSLGFNVIKERVFKKAQHLVKILIKLWGKDTPYFGDVEINENSFIDSIHQVAEQFVDSKKPFVNGGVLQYAKTSTTECLLHARQWLESSCHRIQQEESWRSIDMIINNAISLACDEKVQNTQISFCLNTLLSILLDVQCRTIHEQVLFKTKKTIYSILDDEHAQRNKDEMVIALNKTFTTMIRIHEDYQNEFCKVCLRKWEENNIRSRMKTGMKDILVNVDSSMDTSIDVEDIHQNKFDLSFSSYKSDVPQAVTNGMVNAFDIIELLLVNRSSLFFEELKELDPFPSSKLSSECLTSLVECNPKFTLVSLQDTFLKATEVKKEEVSSSVDVVSNQAENSSTQSSFHDEIRRFLKVSERFRRRFQTTKSSKPKEVSHKYCSDSDVRSQSSALQKLGTSIVQRSMKLNENDGKNDDSKAICKVVCELLLLCTPDFPNEIQVAASRCIGGFSYDIESTDFVTNAIRQNEGKKKEMNLSDPLFSIQSDAFKMLAEFLWSDDVKIAIAAKDTLKALLMMKHGTESYEKVHTPQLERIFAPFLCFDKRSNIHVPTISDDFIRHIYAIVSHNKEIDKKDNSWCWSDKLWTLDSLQGGDIEFDDWIKNIVCSLIMCCYKSKGNAKDSSSADSLSGSSDFFSLCGKICSIEHRFAATLFPGIIYDILISDSRDGSKLLHQSNYYSLYKQAPIGAPFSLANQIMTRCFSNILKSSLQEIHSTISSSEVGNKERIVSDSKAVKAVVEVIDMIRQISESQFQSFTFKRNTLTIPGRDYMNQSDRINYDEKIPRLSWGGRPYGVVMHLNGIEIASAYLRAKSFSSALYYAEMYADNRLGGSSSSFTRVADLHLYNNHSIDPCSKSFEQFSLSGFGIPIEKHKDYGGISLESLNDDISRSKLFHSILSQCYQGLEEIDNLEGLEEQFSAIRFSQSDSNNLSLPCISNSSNEVLVQSLLSNDIELQQKRGTGVSNISDHIPICMNLGQLGMRDILHHYIAGLCVTYKDLSSQSNYEVLKEQWAEETWRTLQWDESLSLFDSQAGNSSDALLSQTGSIDHLIQTLDSSLQRSVTLNESLGFHEGLSSSLFCLVRNDKNRFTNNILSTRQILLERFQEHAGEECSFHGVSEFSFKLRTINEVEELGDVVFNDKTPDEWLGTWSTKQQSNIGRLNSLSFDTVEFGMAAHEISLRLLSRQKMIDHNDVHISLTDHLWKYCSMARDYNKPNVAHAALNRLRRISELYSEQFEDSNTEWNAFYSSTKFKIEEANIMHCKGDITSAIRTSKLVIQSMKRFQHQSPDENENLDYLFAETVLQCGKWLMEYKIDSAYTLLHHYLKPAAKMAKDILDKKDTIKSSRLVSTSNFVLGDFVSSLYDNAEARINSQEWKLSRIVAEGRNQELIQTQKLYQELRQKLNSEKKNKSRRKSLQKEQTELRSVQVHMISLQKEVDIDNKERNGVEKSISSYLKLTIECYGTALCYCKNSLNHAKHVFRMISLWFRNAHRDDDTVNINRLMASVFDKIPSYHFVPLIYQIFSRIGKACADTREFQEVLQNLVYKICVEHPYHGLIQLISLSNGNKIGEKSRSSREYQENVGTEKVEVIKRLLMKIKNSPFSHISDLVDSYTILTNAYITLANMPTDKFVSKRRIKNIKLSEACGGDKKLALDSCLPFRRGSTCLPCILTKPPTIRPGADYGDGHSDPIGSERIASFDQCFSLTENGIHRPKIVICRGTKGGRYKQLVKGEDDIRQDAVMQQVFATVNFLLRNQSEKNASSQNRDLRLYTYNCIPLSPENGVLEWVDHTIPFGEFLLAKGSKGKGVGAHTKYFPGEWENNLCRQHLTNAPANKKLSAFKEICDHFSPAFRFFFLEKFSHSMQIWHEARTKYTRSSAVNSMVGHILGIGDRHSHNILVHQKTGEVVHIDFGIVYEQGKSLNTPETIPFRLTRDVVDGFGPNGTDGTFTTAARATLNLLRGNTSTLLTVLSAVVSDPLYKWCISPVAARQRQREENEDEASDEKYDRKATNSISSNIDALVMAENENDAATRTIAKINEKLQGYEDGTLGERQTVDGQVRLLINAARDPENLAGLFPGWAPWL